MRLTYLGKTGNSNEGSCPWPRLDELNRKQRAAWMQLMSEVTGAGRRVERVRVVTEPPTDYIRSELRLNAGNAAAGEDIRHLPRDQAGDLPPVDYWLFDSAVAVVLNFNDDDTLASMELVDAPTTIEEFCAGRDAAWRRAVSYPAYVMKWADAEPPPVA